MVDSSVIAKLWSAYGVNIIVLTILLVVAWAVGLAMRRFGGKDKGDSKKG